MDNPVTLAEMTGIPVWELLTGPFKAFMFLLVLCVCIHICFEIMDAYRDSWLQNVVQQLRWKVVSTTDSLFTK